MTEKTLYWSLRHRRRGDLLMEFGKIVLFTTRAQARSAFTGQYEYSHRNWRVIRVKIQPEK